MHPPRLLEALLYEPGHGYFLHEKHLRRLAASASALGYPLPLSAIEQALRAQARRLDSRSAEQTKVRLSVTADGDFQLQAMPAKASTPLRCTLSPLSVPSDYLYLRHKTSERSPYQVARERNPGVEEVILYNERGEVTETTTGNLVIELDGRHLTPALEAGLLAGTYREHLIERGKIVEERLTCADVRRARALWMINSVRRDCPLVLLNPGPE